MRHKAKPKMRFDFSDYIQTNRMLARKEELEKNGGRWVSVDRPHKNKKKYDRKRDRSIDGLFAFYNCLLVRTKYNDVNYRWT